MPLPLFELDTPEWLSTAVSFLSFGLICGMLFWGMIFKFRYTGPYTIVETSNREKWRRATILALINTAMFPILGLMILILSPRSGPWLLLPLVFGGVWIVALPIAILSQRWEFEREIKNYQWLDRWIKNGFYHRVVGSLPLNGLLGRFMTAEAKRFEIEGYPDNTVKSDGDEPSS